jgi:hypothetical protein
MTINVPVPSSISMIALVLRSESAPLLVEVAFPLRLLAGASATESIGACLETFFDLETTGISSSSESEIRTPLRTFIVEDVPVSRFLEEVDGAEGFFSSSSSSSSSSVSWAFRVVVEVGAGRKGLAGGNDLRALTGLAATGAGAASVSDAGEGRLVPLGP